jgi:TRAP-type C4-dicarboxylate transport system substrate-binding protein
MFGGAAHAATTLKMATDSGTKGSPAGDALKKWGELIEKKSNGELKVRVFYQNELGGQQEVFDLHVAGDVPLMLNWPMTSYDKRIGVIYTPYMTMSWEEAVSTLFGSAVGDAIRLIASWRSGSKGSPAGSISATPASAKA